MQNRKSGGGSNQSHNSGSDDLAYFSQDLTAKNIIARRQTESGIKRKKIGLLNEAVEEKTEGRLVAWIGWSFYFRVNAPLPRLIMDENHFCPIQVDRKMQPIQE